MKSDTQLLLELAKSERSLTVERDALRAQLAAAHKAIMPRCCPGPEAWPESADWWDVAGARLARLTAVLRAGKEDRWAATHGSDEAGFRPADWVVEAESIIGGAAGGSIARVETAEAERDALAAHVERLREAIQILLNSAHPHPTEHPTMTDAWTIGRSVLAATPAQSLAKVRAEEVGQALALIEPNTEYWGDVKALKERLEAEAANATTNT